MENTKAIVVKNLEATFTDNGECLKVLEDINFELSKGSFTSIIGPSGCGKSTLFRLLSGLPMRDACEVDGNIRVMGRSPEVASREREIGLILQRPTLLEWRDVHHNISLPLEIMGYPKEKQDKKVKKFLKLLDLEKYAKYRPSELSGGMQQKVSIGRALAYDPDILLMDEPFGALDEINRRKMNDEIIRVWQETKKTILFIMHSIDEAVYLSQRVIVLSKKPSTIHKIVKIKLPYPRNREQNSSEYFKYIKEVRQYLNDATC